MILETKRQRENLVFNTLAVLAAVAVWSFFVLVWWGFQQGSSEFETSWVSKHNYWEVYPTATGWTFLVVGGIALTISTIVGVCHLVSNWINRGADQTKQQRKEELITKLENS